MLGHLHTLPLRHLLLGPRLGIILVQNHIIKGLKYRKKLLLGVSSTPHEKIINRIGQNVHIVQHGILLIKSSLILLIGHFLLGFLKSELRLGLQMRLEPPMLLLGPVEGHEHDPPRPGVQDVPQAMGDRKKGLGGLEMLPSDHGIHL